MKLKMKLLSAILLLLIAICSYSQKINVRGTALDTTNGRLRVSVALNDTITKLFANKMRGDNDYSLLVKNKKYVVFTDSAGKFEIEASKKDTLVLSSFRHITRKISVHDFLKKEKAAIQLEPEVCESYIPCNDSFPEHFVFVGKKISVSRAEEKYYCDVYTMDSKFEAEYKIIESVYGKLAKDTLKFVVYDHYGRPRFSNYEYALLFVSRYCDKMVHQKYQYYPLYKTDNNKWASPYSAFDYSRIDSTIKIKPELIKFQEPVYFDITKWNKDMIEKEYPAPYYKIENGKAIALYGNYVPELLELKKQTVLKARGIKLE
jgi:hypothetical protein